jgi:hypothetical protein
MTPIQTAQTKRSSTIPSNEALRIATEDAEKAYRDLLPFRITIFLHGNEWHVDYDLTEPLIAGGGPHYVIDATSGAILHKRYEQ